MSYHTFVSSHLLMKKDDIFTFITIKNYLVKWLLYKFNYFIDISETHLQQVVLNTYSKQQKYIFLS